MYLSVPLLNTGSFVVADSVLRNIYQVDPTTGATAQLLPFGTALSPIALAYDSATKSLYWTDVAAHTINKYSLLSKRSVVIYRNPAITGNTKFLITLNYWFHIETRRYRILLNLLQLFRTF